jgi:hypothetical protein
MVKVTSADVVSAMLEFDSDFALLADEVFGNCKHNVVRIEQLKERLRGAAKVMHTMGIMTHDIYNDVVNCLSECYICF